MKASISRISLSSKIIFENPSMLVMFFNRTYHDKQNNVSKIVRGYQLQHCFYLKLVRSNFKSMESNIIKNQQKQY